MLNIDGFYFRDDVEESSPSPSESLRHSAANNIVAQMTVAIDFDGNISPIHCCQQYLNEIASRHINTIMQLVGFATASQLMSECMKCGDSEGGVVFNGDSLFKEITHCHMILSSDRSHIMCHFY